MVVVHSRRSRRAQVPRESAVDFVAVGRKPVKGANVGNIWNSQTSWYNSPVPV